MNNLSNTFVVIVTHTILSLTYYCQAVATVWLIENLLQNSGKMYVRFSRMLNDEFGGFVVEDHGALSQRQMRREVYE